MKRRGPRGLDSEEQELWQRVARTTTPLKREKSNANTSFLPTVKTQSRPENKATIDTFAVGAKSDTALPSGKLNLGLGSRAGTAQINMDRKAFQKLKRGKSAPEARLDLHGMTVAAAHDALTAFILSAQARGKRLVLVITGKGRAFEDSGPIPARPGILRQQVPHWLRLAPLNSVVLQVSESHRRHGGSGALYVYLRRR
ncbi:MAG: Smr/MutS family protein [Boseongicola sp.]